MCTLISRNAQDTNPAGDDKCRTINQQQPGPAYIRNKSRGGKEGTDIEGKEQNRQNTVRETCKYNKNVKKETNIVTCTGRVQNTPCGGEGKPATAREIAARISTFQAERGIPQIASILLANSEKADSISCSTARLALES